MRTNCIIIHPQPIATFSSDPEVSFFSESLGFITFTNETDVAILNGDNYTFEWDFGDGSRETSNFSPTHTYTEFGSYDVTYTITTEHNCSSTITHTVVLEPDLFFPNVITPNDDNENDVFAIQNLNINFDPNDSEGYHSNELFIYNRWGKRVYYAKNYDTYAKDEQIFIGSQFFNAESLSDGVYYYTFHYKGIIKDIDYHGTITVVR